MRFVTTITVLCIGAAVSFGPRIPFAELAAARSLDEATAAVLGGEPDEVRLAIEARCGERRQESRRVCEEALSARFAAGATSPESVLRLHCTRVGNVWDAPLPDPPRLCEERFGGWVTG